MLHTAIMRPAEPGPCWGEFSSALALLSQVVAQAAEERGWRVVKCEEKVGHSEMLARGASNPNFQLLPTMILSGCDVMA